MSDTFPQDNGKSGGASGANQDTRPEGDLEAQVAKLREDISGIAESLKTVAGERADSARRHAYALRDDVRETGERYFRQAQETAGELEEQLSERVRSEPIKSVLIAAAIGYFYARIFKN